MVRKFLIALENNALAQELQAALYTAQHEVIVATDGLEAVDLALDRRPDVILLGLRLAGLGGLDVARSLRALDLTEHVPIMFLAANKEESKQVSDARMAFVDCLIAPFESEELMTRAEAALRAGDNISELRTRGADTMLAILDPLTHLYHRR